MYKKIRYLFLTIIVIFFNKIALCQISSTTYQKLIHSADSFYLINAFEKSAKNFDLAFKSNGNKGQVIDRYKSARVYATLGWNKSALIQLEKIIYKKYFSDYFKLITEKDFKILYSEKRWKKLVDYCKSENEFKHDLKAKESKGQVINESEGNRIVLYDGIFKNNKFYSGKRYIYNDFTIKLDRILYFENWELVKDSIIAE